MRRELLEVRRQRVDDDPLRAELLHALVEPCEVWLDDDLRLRDVRDVDHAALDLLLELPAQTTRRRDQPFGRLLERDEQSLLAEARTAVDELEGEDRLAGAGRTGEQDRRAPAHARPEQLVEPRDAGAAHTRSGRELRSHEAKARREHLDTLVADLEQVLAAVVIRTAHLHDL